MGKLLTVQEVADQLRVTPLTVRRWINAGDLPATKLGGDKAGWRIDEEDVRTFLERRRFGAETGKAAAA